MLYKKSIIVIMVLLLSSSIGVSQDVFLESFHESIFNRSLIMDEFPYELQNPSIEINLSNFSGSYQSSQQTVGGSLSLYPTVREATNVNLKFSPSENTEVYMLTSSVDTSNMGNLTRSHKKTRTTGIIQNYGDFTFQFERMSSKDSNELDQKKYIERDLYAVEGMFNDSVGLNFKTTHEERNDNFQRSVIDGRIFAEEWHASFHKDSAIHNLKETSTTSFDTKIPFGAESSGVLSYQFNESVKDNIVHSKKSIGLSYDDMKISKSEDSKTQGDSYTYKEITDLMLPFKMSQHSGFLSYKSSEDIKDGITYNQDDLILSYGPFKVAMLEGSKLQGDIYSSKDVIDLVLPIGKKIGHRQTLTTERVGDLQTKIVDTSMRFPTHHGVVSMQRRALAKDNGYEESLFNIKAPIGSVVEVSALRKTIDTSQKSVTEEIITLHMPMKSVDLHAKLRSIDDSLQLCKLSDYEAHVNAKISSDLNVAFNFYDKDTCVSSYISQLAQIEYSNQSSLLITGSYVKFDNSSDSLYKRIGLSYGDSTKVNFSYSEYDDKKEVKPYRNPNTTFDIRRFFGNYLMQFYYQDYESRGAIAKGVKASRGKVFLSYDRNDVDLLSKRDRNADVYGIGYQGELRGFDLRAGFKHCYLYNTGRSENSYSAEVFKDNFSISYKSRELMPGWGDKSNLHSSILTAKYVDDLLRFSLDKRVRFNGMKDITALLEYSTSF